MEKITKILPNLYLGNSNSVINQTIEFNDIGFNVLINCSTEITYDLSSYIIHKYPIDDDAIDGSFEQYVTTAVETIDHYVKTGNIVYVHCVHGVSRSVSIVIYYLMIYHNMSFDSAYSKILFLRPSISPHNNFVRHIKKLYLSKLENSTDFTNIITEGGFTNNYTNV